MTAPISVIIPTLNSVHNLGPTLAALSAGLHMGLIHEVIVADGGSSDEIAEVADEIGAKLVVSAAGRGGQMAKAAGIAKGEWLLFLHSDSVLSPEWPEAAIAHFSSGKAGYFRLKFDASGLAPRLVAGWANLRARWFGLPFGDQGLLLPARLYKKSGGFPDIPLMEDVVLARALRGQLRAIPAQITTSATRYQAEGWVRRGAKNMWLLVRFLLGARPEKLAAVYYKDRT